ncbi:MAG: CHAT domain-containing protein, partial [Trichodesmium sp. MAG_R03]|nr:CHAT domain-containing protein [Trichodesmium sp. MAG_R03]
MAQKIDLNLVEQINKTTGELEGFRVEVKIDNENNSSKIYRRYLVHSVPKSLESSLDIWKETFSQIVNPRTRKNSTTAIAIEENLSQVVDEDDDDEITIDDDNYEEDLPQVVDEDDDDGITMNDDDDEEDTRPNCWESYLNLTTEFNNWLESERWLKVSDLLTDYLDKSGEISVTIQTDNAFLKQLPWQEWNIFKKYSQIEIAISPPEYEPPPEWENIKRHPQVRILVILGDNDNINTDRDSDLLNEVRKYGGEPNFLEQPTLEELKTELTEKKGWNIIFYSGHSETNENGQGVLYLNNDDGIGITIDDIEEELKVAIDQGLYLAIFNSCNGLGIASKLAELRLPQSIVMKESIPDKMAIHFLEYFLKSFSRDEPL